MITTNTISAAWELIHTITRSSFVKDEIATSRAGYSIYRDETDARVFVADLGLRLELVTADGKTTVIHIRDYILELNHANSVIATMSNKIDTIRNIL